MHCQPTVLTDHQQRRSIPRFISASVFNAVFCTLTFFGTFFTLFLNEMGMDKARIGLILSLLPFFNMLSPLFAPMADRMGLKTLFMSTYILRTITAAGMLAIPWMYSAAGDRGAFLYVAVLISVFALLRTMGMTGSMPWTQQLVPPDLLGKFNAASQVLGGLAVLTAVPLASWFIAHDAGLQPFMVVFGIGLGAEIISAIFFGSVPAVSCPVNETPQGYLATLRNLSTVLRDRRFLRFGAGIACATMAWGALVAFTPLYFTEQIGLTASQTMMLQFYMTLGSILSALIWGWAADRYGARPVLLAGLGVLMILPLVWFLLPRASSWSFPLAAVCAVLSGLGFSGRMLGSMRYLYANAVPREHSTAYMAAWIGGMGLIAGLAPLTAGPLIQACSGLDVRLGPLHIDAYTPFLFLAGCLLLTGGLILRPLRTERRLGTGAFVGMFFQGNPLLALESLLRYRFAGAESQRAHTAEKLGHSRTPLGQMELIESLTDPSFHVRFEAAVSAAHMRPNPELIDALTELLKAQQTEFGVVAAWVLGKLGDPRAIKPLTTALHEGHWPIRGAAARALGRLGCVEAIEPLREAFRSESDPRRAIPCASALGQLGCDDVLDDLVVFLDGLTDPTLRAEAALAIARIVGDEAGYIRLWRHLDHEAFSGITAMLERLVKKADASEPVPASVMDTLTAARDHLRQENRAAAFATLAAIDTDGVDSRFVSLLESLKRSVAAGTWNDRMEYPALLLHLLRNAML